MRYRDVCIEAVSYALPERVVSSLEIEGWLRPLYERIGLHEGRLELMSGIRERRFWPAGTLPSEASAQAGRRALAAAAETAMQAEIRAPARRHLMIAVIVTFAPHPQVVSRGLVDAPAGSRQRVLLRRRRPVSP